VRRKKHSSSPSDKRGKGEGGDLPARKKEERGFYRGRLRQAAGQGEEGVGDEKKKSSKSSAIIRRREERRILHLLP